MTPIVKSHQVINKIKLTVFLDYGKKSYKVTKMGLLKCIRTIPSHFNDLFNVFALAVTVF